MDQQIQLPLTCFLSIRADFHRNLPTINPPVMGFTPCMAPRPENWRTDYFPVMKQELVASSSVSYGASKFEAELNIVYLISVIIAIKTFSFVPQTCIVFKICKHLAFFPISSTRNLSQVSIILETDIRNSYAVFSWLYLQTVLRRNLPSVTANYIVYTHTIHYLTLYLYNFTYISLNM